MERALRAKEKPLLPRIPEEMELSVEFGNPVDAYRASWYPGVRKSGPRTVAFTSDDYFEILRAYRFMKG